MTWRKPHDDERRCTAQSKRTKQRCQLWATPNSAVCKWHGSRSPRGRASGNYKGRGYSKDLPTRLAEKYEEAANNPELLSVRGEVAVIELRFRELLQRIATGDVGALWRDLAAAKGEFLKAQSRQDIPAMGRALEVVNTLIDQGAQDWALWDAIGKEAERLARLRQVEHKRLVDMQQMMSAEQANMLLGAIVSLLMEALGKHIADSKTVRDIYGTFSRGLEKHLIATSHGEVAAGAA